MRLYPVEAVGLRGVVLSWSMSRTRIVSKLGCLMPVRTKIGVKGVQATAEVGKKQLAVFGRGIWRLDASWKLDCNIRALKSE